MEPIYKIKEQSDGFHIYRMLQPAENRYYQSSEYIMESGEFWLPIKQKNTLADIEKELEELVAKYHITKGILDSFCRVSENEANYKEALG